MVAASTGLGHRSVCDLGCRTHRVEQRCISPACDECEGHTRVMRDKIWGEEGLIRESAGCSRRRAGFTACREIKLPKIRRVQKFGSGTLVWRENSTRHCCTTGTPLGHHWDTTGTPLWPKMLYFYLKKGPSEPKMPYFYLKKCPRSRKCLIFT